MRRREKGLLREKNRHGNVVWYYREGHGARIRIHGEYGSPEFNATLKAARGYGPAPGIAKARLAHSDPASFAWLVDQYLASPEYLSMRDATRKARKNTLLRIVARDNGEVGASAYRDIDDDDIRSMRNKIATDEGAIDMEDAAAKGKIPMANRTVDILRVFFNWAIDVRKVPGLARNPCLGVKALKDTEAGTNHVWSEEEMLRFEGFYSPGSKERLAYSLLLYSGQRSGDVVRMGRQHIRNGWLITAKQRKTGKDAGVPVLPVLTEAIDAAAAAGNTGDLTFLVNDDGTPMSEFSRWFRNACKRAGLPECSAHGLRHAGATRLASRGARASTLVKIYGFTLVQAETYTRTAENERTTLEDIHLLNHVA